MKAGKRTLKRRAMNVRLKKRSLEMGITTCEVRLEGCLINWALTWAHSYKGRNITTDERWMEAVCACVACHDKIELMKENEMGDLIRKIIANRKPNYAHSNIEPED